VLALASSILAYLAFRGSPGLPSGNLGYRLYTYATALGRFSESPLWGTFFTAEATEKFTLYSIGIAGNVLPTHSDILDLLAQGGCIALLLWALGLARIARIAFRSLLHPGFLDHRWAPYAHALALMSLAGIVTYAFNPILLQPAMAYLLWTNLGLLLGLSLRAGMEHEMR
jgi:O-antigen ligase